MQIFEQFNESILSEVAGSKAVGRRDGRGGSSVCIVGVNVGQQGGHDSRDTGTEVLCGQAVEVCHSLINLLNAIPHCKLDQDLLGRIVEIDLPCIITFCIRDLNDAAVHTLTQVNEYVLMQTRVLLVIGGNLFLSLNLDGDMQSQGSRHG